MFDTQPTPEEAKAIRALKRLEKNWPETLWLFSGAGSLCVMRRQENGDRALTSNGGVDSDYLICTINIPNDGGDW